LFTIFDDQDLLTRAEAHHRNSDYKAAAVYTRSAFEKIVREHCARKKTKVVFKLKQKTYTSEDFWNEIKDFLLPQTKTDVEQYRDLVMNAFSHYNTDKHEIGTELTSAILDYKNTKSGIEYVVMKFDGKK
jgi:hypothetical protein